MVKANEVTHRQRHLLSKPDEPSSSSRALVKVRTDSMRSSVLHCAAHTCTVIKKLIV